MFSENGYEEWTHLSGKDIINRGEWFTVLGFLLQENIEVWMKFVGEGMRIDVND